MNVTKVVSLRLSGELIETVDELATRGKESRSDTLRTLVEDGLEKNIILEKINSLENKLERIMMVLEMTYQIGFIGTSVACEDRQAIINRNSINQNGVIEESFNQERISSERISAYRDKANQRLIEKIVSRFGE